MKSTANFEKLSRFLLLIAAIILGGCDQQQQNPEEAIESHFQRSKAYERQGQYKASIIEARNMIKTAPDNDLGHIRLAELLLEIGNSRAAISVLEPLTTKKSDSKFQLLLIRAYYYSGKFRSAKTVLENYIKTGGDAASEEYNIYYARTVAALGDSNQAIAILNDFVEQNPLANDARKTLAQLLFIAGQQNKTGKIVNFLLDQSKDDPETLYIAAQLAYLRNDLDQAEKYLSNALIVLPNSDLIKPLRAKVLTQLSSVLTEQGRTTEALIYSKLLATENPDAQEAKSKLKQALVKLREQDLEGAEELLTELNSEYPNYDPGAIYLGLVNYQKGDFAKADELFSSNLDPETASPMAISASAINKLKLNQVEGALTTLEQALKSHPTSESLLTIYGQIAITQPRISQKGALALEKAIAVNPKNIQARIPLALYYLENGKREFGIAQLEQSLQIDPNDLTAVSSYAKVMMEDGNKDIAQNAINTLLAQSPENPLALNLAARFKLLVEAPVMAQDLYLRTLQISPDNVEANTALAALALKKGDTDTAIARYTKIIETNPQAMEGYKGLITAYEIKGHPGEGLNRVKRLADSNNQQNPTPAYVLAEYFLRHSKFDTAKDYFNRGNSLESAETTHSQLGAAIHFAWANSQMSRNEFDAARKNLLLATTYAPDDRSIVGTLAELEIKAHRTSEAKRIIAEIASEFPDSSQADLLTGKLAEQDGNPAGALSAYRRGWTKQPSDLAGQLVYNGLIAGKKSDEAALFLDRWLERFPKSIQARLNQATQLQLARADTKALAVYQALLDDHPDHPMILNNIAWLYHSMGDNRAVPTAQKAYEAAPDNYAIIDTYGWILLKSGDARKAKHLLEKAYRQAPDNMEIKAHLEEARKAL